MKYTPVDHDPFAQQGPTLTPVDHDPFAGEQPAAPPETSLVDVIKQAAAMPSMTSTARDRQMPGPSETLDAAKVAGAGAAQAVLGMSESIFRTPEAIQRHIETGVNALPIPEGMGDFIKRGNPFGVLARGVEGVPIAGANTVADEIANAQDTLATSDNFPVFQRLSQKGQQADAALKAALNGDMAPLGQVITDPEAWAGFIGQAAPSLYTSYKSGGAPAFIAWMESMEVASDVADFEKRTGQKVSPEEFTRAQIQVAAINTWLEKFGLDKIMGVKGKNILSSMFKGGVTEGATEGLQELNQNLAKKTTYNPSQDLTEGVLPSVMGGTGSGTAGAGVSHVAQQDTRSPEQIRAEALTQAIQAGVDSATPPSAERQAVEALTPKAATNDIAPPPPAAPVSPLVQALAEAAAPQPVEQPAPVPEISADEAWQAYNQLSDQDRQLADLAQSFDGVLDDAQLESIIQRTATETEGLSDEHFQSQLAENIRRTIDPGAGQNGTSPAPAQAGPASSPQPASQTPVTQAVGNTALDTAPDAVANALAAAAQAQQPKPVPKPKTVKPAEPDLFSQGALPAANEDLPDIPDAQNKARKDVNDRKESLINEAHYIESLLYKHLSPKEIAAFQRETAGIEDEQEYLAAYENKYKEVIAGEKNQDQKTGRVGRDQPASSAVADQKQTDQATETAVAQREPADHDLVADRGNDRTSVYGQSETGDQDSGVQSNVDPNSLAHGVSVAKVEQMANVAWKSLSREFKDSGYTDAIEAFKNREPYILAMELENDYDFYSKFLKNVPDDFDLEEVIKAYQDYQVAPAPAETVEAKPAKQTAAPKVSDDKIQKKIASLRKVADNMESQIEHKLNPGVAQQNLTARRARIANSMRQEGEAMQRVQSIMRGIADALQSGNLDPSLAGVDNKKIATELESRITRRKGEFADTADWNHLGQEAKQTFARAGIKDKATYEAALDAAESFITGPSKEQREALRLREMEQGLIGTRIPGFFPTPKEVASQLVELADIEHGMKVLEPSAGKGDIAEAIQKAEPGVKLDVVEYSATLSDILKAKGFNVVGSDFFEYNKGGYDRIVMNPPWGKEVKQDDTDHIQHAYDLLKPGGRLVAIMSPSPFNGSGKKQKAFRDWFEEVGGVIEQDLESGTFTGASQVRATGVASRIIVIDKEAAKPRALFSKPKRQQTDIADIWQSLAQSEEVFQQPKSDARALRDIAAEVDSGIKVERLDVPVHKRSNTDQEWKLTMPDGKAAYLRENNNGTLELNAAALESGKSRGTAVYNIVATYAHNNGKVFIGDREGLSDAAFYRRTENMLSSALKFGTTRHLRPHPDQRIEWVQGDDKGNLERLIQKHYSNIIEQVPILEDVVYDFAEKQFVHRDQGRSTPVDFESLANHSRGAKAARAGEATLKRAAFTNTLVQETSPEGRRRILAEITRQLRTELDPELRRILYSKPKQKPGTAGLSASEAPITYKAPGTVTKGLPVDHVKKIVAQVQLKWGDGAPPVIVVQSIDDVPPHLTDGDPHNEAVIDTYDNTIYMVAGNLESPRRVYEVLAHEAVGHAAMNDMLGEDFDNVINRVHQLKDAGNKVITEIADEVAKSYGNLDRNTEAKEIIAVMAEKGIKHPIIDRVIAAIKNFLRKLGLTIPYTDTEIRALIARAESRLKSGKMGKPQTARTERGGTGMFSKPPKQTLDAIGTAMKKAPTWEDVKNKLEDWRPGMLPVLTRLHLVDVGKDVLPQIVPYVKRAQQMDADRNHMIIEAADVAKPWAAWSRDNKTEGRQLADLMHDATIAGVDPAEEYQVLITPEEHREKKKVLQQQQRLSGGEAYIYSNQIKELDMLLGFEAKRKEAYPGLKRRWDALPAEAKTIYRQVRDLYTKRFNEVQQALLDRIDRAEISQNEKRRFKEELRRRFESLQVQAPYFPLARFGDYWVVAKKKGDWTRQYVVKEMPADEDGVVEWGVFKHRGRFPLATFAKKSTAVEYAQEQVMETEFYMTEGSGQQKNKAAEMRAKGYQVTTGKKIKNMKAIQGASAGFVSDVIGILDEATGGRADKVKDAIYQLYLTTLPDLSVRKNFIHRGKTQGYNEDALRAFAKQTFHGAYQLAKLQHGDVLEAHLANMREQVGESEDPIKAADILDELQERHEWAMNPHGNPYANIATQAAFIFYLGLTPSAALVNTTQTALVALPVMAADYGWGKASKALTLASRDFFSGKTSMKDGFFSAMESDRVSADEKRAFQQWLDEGVIDKTLAHDMAAQSEKPSEVYSGKWSKIMGVIGYGFHHAERFNREVTALAAYRLARANGKSHEAAIDEGRRVVYESHFDYSSANKARFMQNDAAKVVLIFRQYSLNMTYLLARNTQQMIKGETAEVRRAAKRKLAGVLGQHAIAAGAYGLPLFWLVEMVLNAMFDDKDEPWDFRTEFRNFLADLFGNKVAEAITMGPVNAITGVDLHSRVSLNELWIRSPDRDLEAQKAIEYYMLQLGFGPLGSIATGIGRGIDLMSEGKYERGIEAMTPKAIRDGMKAIRYASEGVTTLSGEQVVDDLNEWELFMQGIGFTPSKVATQYDANRALKNYKHHIDERRKMLMNRLWLAQRHYDRDGIDEAMDEIREFNSKNPTRRIDGDSIEKSRNSRQGHSRQTDHGVYLPRKDRHLKDRVRYGDD